MTDLDLYAIKRDHGGTVYHGGRRWVGPGPGHSRRDASLSVWISDEGRPLVHSFAGDPFSACAAHLGLQRDANPASHAELAILRRARDTERRRTAAETLAFCQAIWEAARPIGGTPAEAYLWSRGLIYDGQAVRYHPVAPRSRHADRVAPHAAMVALVRDVGGAPIGIHVTYLTDEGRKAFGTRSRLMFGAVGGGSVRLEDCRGEALGIGEGIETSGAFGMLKGVPTWAALSTSGLQQFQVPTNVRRLLIAADSDDGGAGMKAATALAERVRRQCDVEIHPAPDGSDWADEGERQWAK